jgi:hypothetical protein
MDRGLSLSPAPVNCSFLFLPRPRRVSWFGSVPFPSLLLRAPSTTLLVAVGRVRACVQGMQTKSGDDVGAASDAGGWMDEECQQPD